jgi:hypothetical protein
MKVFVSLERRVVKDLWFCGGEGRVLKEELNDCFGVEV